MDNAPDLMRKCYKSVVENNPDKELKMYLVFKSKIKKIVTHSDILSTIRREYRYRKIKRHYSKMKEAYDKTEFSVRLQHYKNVHYNQRCFIIGNGPSLTPEDLEKIKYEKTFAANRIYLIYGKTNWRPTYYLCQDRQLIQTLKEYYCSCTEKVFLGYQALYEYGINYPDVNYYLCDNRECNHNSNSLEFSDKTDQSIIDGGSVLYSAIQLAVYMGFKEIYLLGVDHNFSHTLDKNRRIIEHTDVEKDYFDDRYKDAFKKFEEKGKIYAAPDKEMIDCAFKTARDYCDTHGIKIYNATRGGKLEIFERVNFDDII